VSGADAAGGEAATSEAKKPAQGLSQFLAKVLDQLSLSAWLPAAMLVGSTALLIQFDAHRSQGIAAALQALTEKPLGLLILMLFALVLATLVTQALQFEAIRFLEGYWGCGAPLSALAALLIRQQLWRLARLTAKRDNLEAKAFRQAHQYMVDYGVVPYRKRYILQLLADEFAGADTGPYNEAVEADKRLIDWPQYAPAAITRRLDALKAKIDEYPDVGRTLPTKLGNTLRAVEDQLVLDSSHDLEGYINRNWNNLSKILQEEHDQYRTRLDLYCLLVFVLVALGALVLVMFKPHSGDWRLGTALALTYWLLAGIAYSAAVASARGYGSVLRTINDAVQPSPTATPWWSLTRQRR